MNLFRMRIFFKRLVKKFVRLCIFPVLLLMISQLALIPVGLWFLIVSQQMACIILTLPTPMSFPRLFRLEMISSRVRFLTVILMISIAPSRKISQTASPVDSWFMFICLLLSSFLGWYEVWCKNVIGIYMFTPVIILRLIGSGCKDVIGIHVHSCHQL